MEEELEPEIVDTPQTAKGKKTDKPAGPIDTNKAKELLLSYDETCKILKVCQEDLQRTLQERTDIVRKLVQEANVPIGQKIKWNGDTIQVICRGQDSYYIKGHKANSKEE